MQYYVVTEGRANRLDLLQLRDRSTYGLDWMVYYASSAADGIRQWEQFEAEASQYRAATAAFAPPWQAEREVVAAEAADRVRAEQSVLRERAADLDAVRQELEEIAAPAPAAIRPRRRAATSSKKRGHSTSAKTDKKRAPKKAR